MFDASRLRQQREFATALGEADVHLVLDTEAAELAAPAKYAGHARRVPWAWSEPLGPDRFPRTGAMHRYIDELNEQGGLSGTDIANIAGVLKATVSRWKAGTVRP